MRWDPLSLSRKQREERRLRRGPRENLLNFGGQKGARETRRGQVPFDLLLLANLNMVFQVHPATAGVAWPVLHAPTPGQSLTVTLKGYFCVICHFMPLSDFASSESILTCPRVHAHAHTHVCMYIWTCMYTCTYVCLKRYIIFHAANMYVCVCVSVTLPVRSWSTENSMLWGKILNHRPSFFSSVGKRTEKPYILPQKKAITLECLVMNQ